METDIVGHDRYFFDEYFRKTEESSQKQLELPGQRTLNNDQIEAYEHRFKELSRDMGPNTRNNLVVGGSGMLALTQGPSANSESMDNIMAELEQSQVPIEGQLKDRTPYHDPLRSGWGTPYYHVEVHIELPWYRFDVEPS